MKLTSVNSPMKSPKLPVGVKVCVPTGTGSNFWFWLNTVCAGSAGNAQSLLHAALHE